MKYLLLLPLLTSCSLLNPLTPIMDGGPTPIQAIVDQGPPILAQAASGNYLGAIYGAIGLASVLLGKKATGHILKRMKDSEPGQII